MQVADLELKGHTLVRGRGEGGRGGEGRGGAEGKWRGEESLHFF